jgi:hypothetical protein
MVLVDRLRTWDEKVFVLLAKWPATPDLSGRIPNRL